MKRFFFLFLFLIPCVVAESPIDAYSMEATVYITNTLSFEETGSNSFVEEARGKLTWFPKQTRLQEVISLEITPDAVQTDDYVLFSWEPPRQEETLAIEATVKTRNAIIPVRERIPFPIAQVPAEVAGYLQPGEITDQTTEIQRLAQDLAHGKDDAYEVVFAIADWTTTNIEYSLDSLRQPAIQTASEVLDSRWGKCDEMTGLFISLVRAVGIPARFVAGYSFTNSDIFENEWGGHGWAEVWYPDVGWVPYDVTYGEYGYLDAGHIQLKTSEDAKETSIDYTARGSAFSLETEPLDIFVTPQSYSTNKPDVLDIKLYAPQDVVGFGSAALIVAEIKNLQDYYVSTRLDLARTTNTEFFGDAYDNILLKPHEFISVPFLVKIDDSLERGYRYEFPFSLSSRIGEEASITIDVRQDAPVFDRSAFDQALDKYHEDDYEARDFSVTCDRGSTAYCWRGNCTQLLSYYGKYCTPNN